MFHARLVPFVVLPGLLLSLLLTAASSHAQNWPEADAILNICEETCRDRTSLQQLDDCLAGCRAANKEYFYFLAKRHGDPTTLGCRKAVKHAESASHGAEAGFAMGVGFYAAELKLSCR